MGGSAAPIDEIVGFLDRFAKSRLQTVQLAYPRHRAILEPGLLAGPADEDPSVRVAVALAGLEEALSVSGGTLTTLRDRLTRSQRWSFAGQLLSTIAGAGIIAIVASDAAKVAGYTAGLLALLGSMATLFAKFLDGTLQPTTGKVLDIFRELSDARVEAVQIHTAIRIATEHGQASLVTDSIGRANELCLTIGKLVSRAL